MRIITLIENTTNKDNLHSEHGLSFYIETNQNKILFDTGASELFAENAQKLNVDLTDVDMCIISHGHYDHGGGLKAFMKINSKAKIYINKKAFDKYYAKKSNGELIDIGLDEALLSVDRFIFIEDYYQINEGLELFSNVRGNYLIPSGNKCLLMKSKNTTVPDSFEHEQNMIISENGKTLLIAGCAHRGIINIINHMDHELGQQADFVIGGFHLYNPSNDKSEDIQIIEQIAGYLMKTKSQYYTCHCTGIESFKNLKLIMGEKIKYLSTGDELIL